MPSSPRHNKNIFVNLVRGSVILTALDRFTAYIYHLIKHGFFGWLFTGYDGSGTSRIFEVLSGLKPVRWLEKRRRTLCRRMDTSLILNFIPALMGYFLECRLRVYGAFLASFGLYTMVVTAISAVIAGQLDSLLENTGVLVAMVMLISSLPLILSGKNLSGAIHFSSVGRTLLTLTGFPTDGSVEKRKVSGHMNTAFLAGIICGALTYRFPPLWILLSIFALIWLYLVVIRPEIGVMTLFVAVPWLPTMALAAMVIVTTLCWLLKLIRGKRVLSPEPLDVVVAAFLILTGVGGVVSLSPASLKPALLMVCLMMGYFVTVGLLTSREWLFRCASLAVLSAALQSIAAIVMLVFGIGYSSDAWLDAEMFAEIGGRAVGTLENPNMLGEYLILLIPIAITMFIGRGEGLSGLTSFFCLGCMGLCLILTSSRGAWLGLIFAVLLILFIWHRRSMWLMLAGCAAIPFLPMIVPASIWQRFASIGDLSDSSTAYRVHIWHGSVKMIGDNWFSGIGVGEGAWRQIYPLYSYMGIEAAPHSHNLFLQIWLELGIVGFVLFLLLLLLLFQSGFTMFGRISGHRGLSSPDISSSMLSHNLSTNVDGDVQLRRSKTQLRLSAAGPMCAIAGVLVQGLTDYSWYNYRVFLMFWLVFGLASAYIRSGRALAGREDTVHRDQNASEATLPLRKQRKKERGGKAEK